MMISPIYFAIFYDTAKPKTMVHAMHKRINTAMFHNLSDEMEGKRVFLGEDEFKITGTQTFNIYNSVDNHFFVVCDVEKIKK